MKIGIEQRLHALQLEADGIAAIIAAIDNTLPDYDENQTITAIFMLLKLSKDHADNIQAAINALGAKEAVT